MVKSVTSSTSFNLFVVCISDALQMVRTWFDGLVWCQSQLSMDRTIQGNILVILFIHSKFMTHSYRAGYLFIAHTTLFYVAF